MAANGQHGRHAVVEGFTTQRRGSGIVFRKQEPRYKVMCREFVDSAPVQTVTTLLTLYALFGDNIRLMATDKPMDPVFGIITILAMCVFFIEIVMSCIGKAGYFLGFFFWLDTVSTLSLILDIPAVADYLFGQDQDAAGGELRAGRAGRAGARAGRIVRVIRLIRIVKLYKAMQEQEARRKRRKTGSPGDDDIDDWMDEEESQQANAPERESRVGRKLSDMTTRRVIILVLVLLFVLPNLDAQGLQEMPTSGEYGVDRVHTSFMSYWNLLQSENPDPQDNIWARRLYEHNLLMFVHYHNWFSSGHDIECDMCERPENYKAHIFWVGFYGSRREELAAVANMDSANGTDPQEWAKKVLRSTNTYRMEPLLPQYALDALSKPWNRKCDKYFGVSLNAQDEDGKDCPAALRYNERTMLGPGLQTSDQWKEHSFIGWADKRPFTRFEAMLETLKILFICVVLAAGSMMFSKDANMLVLHPLEQMISKVEKIRDNPLYAMKLGDEEFKREEMAKHKMAKQQQGQSPYGWRALKQKWKGLFSSGNNAEPMETVILEKTIIKIGQLLALGFGEAGANTIGQNMKGADTAGVNAMVPGTRCDCNIGYISIQNFSVATEVLQGGVMTFVNQIAEIVHGVADEYHGAVNRNSGDSFLLVWQPERRNRNEVKWQEELDDPAAYEKKLKQDRMKVSEMSFVACVKIIAAIQRSPVLAEYRWHPGLLQRLRNYSVQLAFALHHGWAIEGAIGSEFKIDASYLSPNVGIAMRLQEACKSYGVRILVSETIMKLMGPEMRSKVRLIDRVIVPGSKEPLRIFTMDLEVSVLPVDPPLQHEGLIWNMRQRFKARQALEAIKQSKLSAGRCMVKDLEAMEDAKAMRARFSERMFQVFGMAFHNYIAGEWKIAQGYFTETRRVLGDEDGPSAALLEFMAETEFEAPPTWQGYRELPVPKHT